MKTKHKRLIALSIVAVISLSCFFGGYQKAYANPISTVILGSGLVVLASSLVAMGYNYLTTGDVNSAWNKLNQDSKDALTNVASHELATSGAMTTFVIGATVWNNLVDTFGTGVIDNKTYMTAFESLTPNICSSLGVSTITNDNYLNGTVTSVSLSPQNYSYMFQTNGEVYGELQSTQTTIKLYSTSDVVKTALIRSYQGSGVYIGAFGTVTTTTGTKVSMGSISNVAGGSQQRLYGSKNAIPVYVGQAIVGWVGSMGNVVSEYSFDDQYANYTNGDKRLAVPLNDAPDTNTSYNGESISLDSVIAGYGSLQNFFDAGGAITLSDGTKLSGSTAVNEISNSDIQDYVLGQATWYDKILNGVNSMSTTLSGTLSGLWESVKGLGMSIPMAITDSWDWIKEQFRTDVDNWDLNFDAFKNLPLADKFPFCIPFDFYNSIAVWSASPSDYQFTVNLETSYFEIHHTVDLSPFQVPFQFFRGFCIIFFSYILIVKTSTLIRW